MLSLFEFVEVERLRFRSVLIGCAGGVGLVMVVWWLLLMYVRSSCAIGCCRCCAPCMWILCVDVCLILTPVQGPCSMCMLAPFLEEIQLGRGVGARL